MTEAKTTDSGVVLVTGAAKRIGRAIAFDFGSRGWTVAVHYQNSFDEAESLVEEIGSAGGQAKSFRADLSDLDACQNLVPAVAAVFGPLTCLINNASIFEYDVVQNLKPEVWQAHQAINLRAPMLLTKAFAENLADNPNGNIINLIDQRVWNLTPHFHSYTLSKSALWTMTQTSALALAPHIRVNAIGPGPVLASKGQSKAEYERQVAATPLQRAPQIEELCAAVRFILATPSMTGQMLALDSGQHLGSATSVQNA